MPDETEGSREEKVETIVEEVEHEREEAISDEIEQDAISEEVDEVYVEPVDTDFAMEPEETVVDASEVAEEEEEPEPEDLKEEPEVQEYPDYLNLKIDGEMRKVPSSQVWDSGVRSLQKELTSDVRLEQASRAKREAEASLQDAKERAESMTPSPAQSKLMREVAQGFEVKFPTLADDENLRNLVVLESNKLLSEGNPNDWTTYEKAATTVKTWHDNLIGVRKNEQDWQSKREKKAAMANATLIGVNAKTETLKVEPKEQSTSDIINEMRIARGQS